MIPEMISSITTYLLSLSALTTKISNKLHPLTQPPQTKLPYVTYISSSADTEDISCGSYRDILTFFCYASSLKEAQEIRKTISDSLLAKQHQFIPNSGASIKRYVNTFTILDYEDIPLRPKKGESYGSACCWIKFRVNHEDK